MRTVDYLDKQQKAKNICIQTIKYILLLLWVFIVIFPLSIIFFTSFKTDAEYIKTSVFQMPSNFFNFNNYITTFKYGNFLTGFKNSFILVFFGTLGSVLTGTMLAYCLSRFDFKMKKAINFLYIFSAMVPGATLQVTIYPMLVKLGLTGHLAAPILLYNGTDIIQIWIYLQFMNKISISLDESAMLDGASYFKIFKSIILPLLAPATATIVIIKSISIYNDMFTQYLYNTRPNLYTIVNSLMAFSGIRSNVENQMSAGIIMAMLPTIVLFIFLQKYILSGITMGAIKE